MGFGGGGINAVRGIVCEGVSRTSGTLPPIQGRIDGDCRGELGSRWRCNVQNFFSIDRMNLRGGNRTLVEYQLEGGDSG